MQRRMIKRDSRQIRSPARFLSFCRKVKHGLTDTPNLPDSIAALRQQYFEQVDRSETTYHLALNCTLYLSSPSQAGPQLRLSSLHVKHVE